MKVKEKKNSIYYIEKLSYFFSRIKRLLHLLYDMKIILDYELLNKIIYFINVFCFICFRFINARRRIVQPMIDQSNRAGKTNPLQPTNIYTYSYNTRDTYYIVPSITGISHKSIFHITFLILIN